MGGLTGQAGPASPSAYHVASIQHSAWPGSKHVVTVEATMRAHWDTYSPSPFPVVFFPCSLSAPLLRAAEGANGNHGAARVQERPLGGGVASPLGQA